MHPAFSVIFFTTASGAGYGLMALLGIGYASGFVPAEPTLMVTGMLLSLTLVTAGLLSSTLHLGHPERAWRALSQWRTSWLSREGVCALVTYVPAVLFTVTWMLGGEWRGLVVAGVLAAIGAVATVGTTGMIYASLRAIPAWSNHWVPLNYGLLAAASGALLLHALMVFFGTASPLSAAAAVVLIILAAAGKLAYWRFIDTATDKTSAASATGLAPANRLRQPQPPHSEANYLQQEMGFRIARRHARRLRHIALIAGMIVPAMGAALALIAAPPVDSVIVVVAVVSLAAGVLVERWLFFAEARHAVSYYYPEGPESIATR